MEFRSYLVRRLAMLVPVLFGVTVLIFLLLQLFSPIERAALYVKNPAQFQHIDEIIAQYGLDAPIWNQYITWMNEIFHGNFGWSRVVSLPVTEAIGKFLPATVELALFATPLIIIGGIFFGSKAAANKDKFFDHATRFGAIIGWSLPTFWLGLVLLMVFYGYFNGLLPPERLSTEMSIVVNSSEFVRYTGINFLDGIMNGNWQVFWDSIRHMILPVITLTVVNIAFIMRLMRSSMLEALGKGYITTARAKGLTENIVVNVHARRNALIPVLTISGFLFASIVNGVVITETIFNYKGLGWWAWQSAVQIDIPSILAFALFNGVLFVVTNTVVDLLYARIDPRIRVGGKAS
ncbi:MAG: ABC transporter permease [Dehalogenimonas sp.]|uniref:ABC transporter permease n=1 Tax=Candidatus Dehalogenimonas loeffleri TaxID=3127115 RepID=A0ABZ2J5Z3_9CHLR|nr:ABC transporter permease [Dehalogenimonas sp.]